MIAKVNRIYYLLLSLASKTLNVTAELSRVKLVRSLGYQTKYNKIYLTVQFELCVYRCVWAKEFGPLGFRVNIKCNSRAIEGAVSERPSLSN